MPKTPEQKEANRLNAAKRRREQPGHVREIARRCYANGGAERQRDARQRKKAEDFFGYRIQFARRFNPAITVDDLKALWDAQGGRCALTGEVLEARCGENGLAADGAVAQLDHIQPVTRGGSHELSNLRWVTTRVNLAKRNLTDEEFLALCQAVVA